MAEVRWHRISAALAAHGHTVHMASAEIRWRFSRPLPDDTGVTIVPVTRIDWPSYDMVKTLFHAGFETLEKYGGASHPFIISKLGSVVGPTDMDGIYFYGRQRQKMFETQERIAEASRYVALLSQSAVDLWREMFGGSQEVLLVPGAADAVIPPPLQDPYPSEVKIRCVFSGNFYQSRDTSQPEAHRAIAARLNELGRLLSERGARLFVVGPGDRSSLDVRFVTYCGAVTHEQSWDYLHFATVGTVVAAGPFMHNNESTKIYHYLRAGLPVVSEAGFPNDNIVRESGLGVVVDNGDPEAMADRIIEAADTSWDRSAAIQYILKNHTWEHRAAIYHQVLQRHA
ncbi:MAG TPA: glycosyltransferase [Gemmatimonadaceae bacterium]|nr:glycosyltransferase [Gemmatimonadaceae bacterium]